MLDVFGASSAQFEQGRVLGQEEERNRITKAFHDEVSSSIVAALFLIETAKSELEQAGLPQAELVAKASDILTETTEKIADVLVRPRRSSLRAEKGAIFQAPSAASTSASSLSAVNGFSRQARKPLLTSRACAAWVTNAVIAMTGTLPLPSGFKARISFNNSKPYAGHLEVGDDQIRIVILHCLQTFNPVFRQDHIGA